MGNRILVVGVSQYRPPFKVLPGVSNDVRAMADLLTSEKGVFDRHGMRVLLDGQATRSAIEGALDEVLGAAGADDTVLVYFAGHGGVTSSGACFVPYDAGADLVATLDFAELKRRFDQTASTKVILMVDSCHSGALIPRGGATPREAVERALKVVAGTGRVVLAACRADQSAWEDPATGHGNFTHAILRGLQGEAEDKRGEITVSGLFDFVDHEIGGNDQRPMFLGSLTGRMVLVYTKPRSTPTAVPPAAKGKPNARLLMLGDLFVTAQKVTENGPRVTIVCTTGSAVDDAKMRGLRDKVPFAYGLMAGLATVRSKQRETDAAGVSMWQVELDVQSARSGGTEMATSGYSAHELARLRASRLLTGQPPAPATSRRGNIDMVEDLIKGLGEPRVTQSVFVSFGRAATSDPDWLAKARLSALYLLQATQCVDHTLELDMTLTKPGVVHVHFRGERLSGFAGPGEMLEVEGDCTI